MVEYGGIALSYACRLEDDEVIAGVFTDVDGFLYMCAEGPVAVACGQAAHIGAGAGNGVHPDAIAQQGAAGLFLGGVDGDHGECLIRETVQVTADELVCHGGFAGAAGACDADDGDGLRGRG